MQLLRLRAQIYLAGYAMQAFFLQNVTNNVILNPRNLKGFIMVPYHLQHDFASSSTKYAEIISGAARAAVGGRRKPCLEAYGQVAQCTRPFYKRRSW